ncbi:sodium/proton antiporter, NhaA family [Pedobacter westerhofensis]|uniref:Na(+)/H(+) antiporter NhaA n=1 Tax=Pedobacter westerhofensis TaxID=425512 RepID=A0A521BFC8_9SPHI|nr:Na+/H+ antiporter NhaA [Pedobacter westerhofensis]SMO45779.1 sodium/proton antiporter, NhaA family [Pedobacter westerhofensis]
MANKTALERIVSPIDRFIQLEYSSGVILLLSVLTAILWANSAFQHSYHELWELRFAIGYSQFKLNEPLHIWINDGLMAIFFFVIGLELKREFLEGELSSLSKAVLPMMAAAGGMIVPALIYFLMNRNTVAEHGWGIPMATDIAFALALLSMAGKHIPGSVKVFLSALAVSDDLGAVLVIAFFYTQGLDLVPLGIAGLFVGVLIAGNSFGIKSILFYLLIGIAVWLCFLFSGVHATLAGIVVAFTIPSGTLLQKMEDGLHPWVAYLIMPLFALSNSGISIGADFLQSIINPVSIGVASGLVIGKCVGIFLFTWVMVKTGVARLPSGATWKHLFGIALLGGIGFTMSLFIGGLAFKDAQYVDQAKYGILLGSVAAGILGSLVLKHRPGAPL